MEDTILTYDEFIALDSELTLLLYNELVVRVDAHPDHEPAWRYRINLGGELERLSYVDAMTAAYARYRAMTTGVLPTLEVEERPKRPIIRNDEPAGFIRDDEPWEGA